MQEPRTGAFVFSASPLVKILYFVPMKMIKVTATLLLPVMLVLVACSNEERKPVGKSENDVDAARNFIRAALDGDFDKAKTMLLPDSLNYQDLEASSRLYAERMSDEEKKKYKGASILVYENRQLNDSTSIVYYANTYRNQKDSLKVVKQGDDWLIDFKYIFKHKPDSLP